MAHDVYAYRALAFCMQSARMIILIVFPAVSARYIIYQLQQFCMAYIHCFIGRPCTVIARFPLHSLQRHGLHEWSVK